MGPIRILLPAVVILAAVLTLCATDAFAQTATPLPREGVTPKVLLSLTEHVTRDFPTHLAQARPQLVGQTLPLAGAPHEAVATLDTAISAVVLSATDSLAFGISDAGLAGRNTIGLSTEGNVAHLSTPGGVFVSNISPAGQSAEPKPGIVNTSVVHVDEQNDIIPTSIAGMPVLHFYTTLLRYSELETLESNGTVIESPSVEMLSKGSVQRPSTFVELDYEGNTPAFIQALAASCAPDVPCLHNNPSFPTNADLIFVRATLNHAGKEETGNFLLATGRKSSVISSSMADRLGIDPASPSFTGEVEAGLETVAAPGVVLDRFVQGDEQTGLDWEQVPFFIHDNQPQSVLGVDGHLGMNLFAGYDLVLNLESEDSYLGLLPLGEPFTRKCVGGTGDINQDGLIDFRDFVLLSTQFGQRDEFLESDLNCDGAVTFDDFLILSTNFSTAGIAAVPEPAGNMILGAVVLGVLFQCSERRRRQSRE